LAGIDISVRIVLATGDDDDVRWNGSTRCIARHDNDALLSDDPVICKALSFSLD